MTVDYTIFYKQSLSASCDWAQGREWDVFLSAYNVSERVRRVFDSVRASEKHWLVHSEYGFTPAEIPKKGSVFAPSAGAREDDFIHQFVANVCPDLSAKRLCVDISGFMRPHLLFLLRVLLSKGVRSFDVLYSEPSEYLRREQTEFAKGSVAEVRPIAGFEGVHQPSSSDADLLIVGAGYEHDLMRQVANAKSNARKIQLLGFPPLQADFYQDNVLNAFRAAEAMSATNQNHPLFAPANDPFVTAAVLQETVVEQRRRGIKNLYLCPLSSRPQALGFALYFLHELDGQAVSIIYPFAPSYARETTAGLSRVWQYTVELPAK